MDIVDVLFLALSVVVGRFVVGWVGYTEVLTRLVWEVVVEVPPDEVDVVPLLPGTTVSVDGTRTKNL